MDQGDVSAAVMAQMAEEVFRAGDLAETAEQVVAMAAAEVDADHAGIVLFQGQRDAQTIAATSQICDLVIRLPYDGPYWDGRWSRQALIVDLRWDQRWPEWSTAVHELGLHHLLGVELTAGNGRRVGVLTLFTEQRREFSDEDIAVTHIFGRHAALAIQVAHHRENMQAALDTRKLIGQAQGILMERYQMSDKHAFELLRRLSQTHNRKLRDIAHEVVDTRRIPETDTTAPSSRQEPDSLAAQ